MVHFVPTALIAASVLAFASPASAGTHRHRAATRAAPPQAAAEPVRQPFMFYPQHIQGGVAGNLPFNNQIRKHTDGLNANGGR